MNKIYFSTKTTFISFVNELLAKFMQNLKKITFKNADSLSPKFPLYF